MQQMSYTPHLCGNITINQHDMIDQTPQLTQSMLLATPTSQHHTIIQIDHTHPHTHIGHIIPHRPHPSATHPIRPCLLPVFLRTGMIPVARYPTAPNCWGPSSSSRPTPGERRERMPRRGVDSEMFCSSWRRFAGLNSAAKLEGGRGREGGGRGKEEGKGGGKRACSYSSYL